MAMVDDRMINTYHILLLQMMENAGAALAALAVTLAAEVSQPGTIVVLAGTGGNGGGGLVAARRLAAWGWPVTVILASSNLTEVPRIQRTILEPMAVSVTVFEPGWESRLRPVLEQAVLVIDALVGYGLKGNPEGAVSTLIQQANEASTSVLALDVPSGLNPSTGIPEASTMRARATLTLALPKSGLLEPAAQPYVGKLYLADIGIPQSLYAQMGLVVPPVFDGQHYIPLV